MNQNIIVEISNDLNIQTKQVETVLNLLSEGNTIPFIARYRKEWTNSMTDETLRTFSEKYNYYNNFYDRLQTIHKSIEDDEIGQNEGYKYASEIDNSNHLKTNEECDEEFNIEYEDTFEI